MNRRSVWLMAACVSLASSCGGGESSPPRAGDLLWARVENPGSGLDNIAALASDASSVYVAGNQYEPGSAEPRWRIEKRSKADGALDPAFGSGGVVSSAPAGGGIIGVTIDSSHLYVVGWDVVAAGNRAWRIEKRSLADGALVQAFGVDGVVISDPSAGLDNPNAIAVDDAYLYVVGSDLAPGTGAQWRIEKRRLDDGSLVEGFGAGGIVVEDPSADWEYCYDIAIDASAMYLVGVDRALGSANTRWRIEKRALDDGALVPGFGDGGVVISNPSDFFDWGYRIVIADGAMFVGGTDLGLGVNAAQWRLEKRSLEDGALVPAFGVGGVVTNGLGGSPYHFLNALAIDAGALYLVGADYTLGDPDARWRIERRSAADGALDPELGDGGVVTENQSGDYDSATAVVVDDDAFFVGGFDTSPGTSDRQWRLEKRRARAP